MNLSDDKYADALYRLLSVMSQLREQCPWNKKQTLESLRHRTIEETYELSEAILEGDLDAIKTELGDLMSHIVFYSHLGLENQAFDIADVIHGICDKLVNRHPHVFGEISLEHEQDVQHHWELLKLKEQQDSQGVLAGVPQSLPALIKALRIQEKAHGIGFDWAHHEEVWQKVEEEIGEFKQCLDKDADQAENEFGDLLFSLINYARFLGINPETALEKTNKKFIQRFKWMESAAQREGQLLQNMTLAEMETYWQEAKQFKETTLNPVED